MINAVQNDSRLIYDYLVPTSQMNFLNGDGTGDVELHFNDSKRNNRVINFHNNAVTQLGTKLGIPTNEYIVKSMLIKIIDKATIGCYQPQ